MLLHSVWLNNLVTIYFIENSLSLERCRKLGYSQHDLQICVTCSYSTQDMKAARIRASAVYIAISIAAAASNTYFFSTNHASAPYTLCKEVTSRANSTSFCAFMCTQMRCYRFRWNNGVCSVRRRSTSLLSEGLHFQLKKVSSCIHFIISHTTHL